MAGKFNDEQLRLQALKLRDPYDQSNLVYTVPESAALLDITNIYVYEQYPLKKVYCVECGGRKHKHGFTAMLTTGHRVLYGSTCGARRFGQSWTEAERSYGRGQGCRAQDPLQLRGASHWIRRAVCTQPVCSKGPWYLADSL